MVEAGLSFQRRAFRLARIRADWSRNRLKISGLEEVDRGCDWNLPKFIVILRLGRPGPRARVSLGIAKHRHQKLFSSGNECCPSLPPPPLPAPIFSFSSSSFLLFLLILLLQILVKISEDALCFAYLLLCAAFHLVLSSAMYCAKLV